MNIYNISLKVILLGNSGFPIKNEYSYEKIAFPLLRKWKLGFCVMVHEEHFTRLFFPTTGTATVYSRYKYIEKVTEETRVMGPGFNKAALVFGMISCFGMCVVATFQARVYMWCMFKSHENNLMQYSTACLSVCWFQETAVIEAHDFGALLFFVSGIIYTLLQSIISSRAYPFGSTIGVCRTRWIIAIIATLAFFPSILSHKSTYQVKLFWFPTVFPCIQTITTMNL